MIEATWPGLPCGRQGTLLKLHVIARQPNTDWPAPQSPEPGAGSSLREPPSPPRFPALRIPNRSCGADPIIVKVAFAPFNNIRIGKLWVRRRTRCVTRVRPHASSPASQRPSRRCSPVTAWPGISPLDDFKAGAKRAGASLNDAYIAGGTRRYHEKLDQPIARLPMVFPVSAQTAADGLGGKRFVGGQFDAAWDEPDPVACMRQVGALTEQLPDEPAPDELLRVMPVVGRLPTPLLGKLMPGVTAAQDVQASNVPGLRSPVYLARASRISSASVPCPAARRCSRCCRTTSAAVWASTPTTPPCANRIVWWNASG